MTPDSQHGQDKPLPRIHEDTTVPEQLGHLTLGQHVLDQPPYNKLAAIVPRTLFEKPDEQITQKHGLYQFLRAFGHWAHYHHEPLPATPDGFSYEDKREYLGPWMQMVNPKQREQLTPQGVLIVFQSIRRVLAPYPHVYAYLWHKREGFHEDGSPNVPTPLAKWYRPETTFAAYQHAMIRGEQIARDIGLPEILPRGYSTQDDIRNAMPPKQSKINIRYRLLVQSEAMK